MHQKERQKYTSLSLSVSVSLDVVALVFFYLDNIYKKYVSFISGGLRYKFTLWHEMALGYVAVGNWGRGWLAFQRSHEHAR